MKYSYIKDGKFLVGRLADYPEYVTQGTDIADLEAHLREIYGWIVDGTLQSDKKMPQYESVFEVAG